MPRNNFHHDLDLVQVLKWVNDHPGVTTLETKTFFHCESRDVRKAMGALMYRDKVLVMPYGAAVAWIPVTGKRGRPNIKQLRDAWRSEIRTDDGKFAGQDEKFRQLREMGEGEHGLTPERVKELQDRHATPNRAIVNRASAWDEDV